MSVIELLTANWDSLVLVAAFLLLCAVLVKRGETAKLERVLFALVTAAEKQLGSGTGALKLSTVMSWLYERIPAIVRLLYTEKELEKIVEDALEKAKEQWEQNASVKGYITEKEN